MTICLRSNPSSALISSPCSKDQLTGKSCYDAQRQWCSEDDEATVSTTAPYTSPVQFFLDSLSGDRSPENLPLSSPLNVIEPDLPLLAPCCDLKRHYSIDSDCDSVVSGSSRTRRPPSKKRQKQGVRVRFADPLISAIYTRPRTLKEEKASLHYSFEEMDQFREEYYLECERQHAFLLKGPSASDYSSVSSGSSAHLIDDDDEYCMEDKPSASRKNGFHSSFATKHPISKVMVVHNDDVLMYCASKRHGKNSCNGEYPSFRAVYTADDDDDYSFDNPAFWNGNLTWY